MSSCMVGLRVFNDNKDESVTAKIEMAAARYKAKFGSDAQPTTCLVNIGLESAPALLAMTSLNIIPVKFVQPDEFWVGVLEETPEAGVKVGYGQVVTWERQIHAAG